jgi:hypothetical protein
MSCLHFGVGGAAIGNVLVVEDPQGAKGNLIDLAGKTTDSGPSCELIKAASAILLGSKANKHRLHGSISLLVRAYYNAVHTARLGREKGSRTNGTVERPVAN